MWVTATEVVSLDRWVVFCVGYDNCVKFVDEYLIEVKGLQHIGL